MTISHTVHHPTLTPAEGQRLAEMNQRLIRYFQCIVGAHWNITHEGREHFVTLNVHARGGYFHVYARAERAGEAIDRAFDKIVRQSRRDREAAITARSRRGLAAKHSWERDAAL